MTEEIDLLTRLESLKVDTWLSERLTEMAQWMAGLPEGALEEFVLQWAGPAAKSLGLLQEQLLTDEEYEEAFVYIMLASWKAYQLQDYYEHQEQSS